MLHPEASVGLEVEQLGCLKLKSSRKACLCLNASELHHDGNVLSDTLVEPRL